MGGDDVAGVPKAVVLRILREAGVRVYAQPNCPGSLVLAKGDVLDTYDSLPDVIGRSLLGRFSAKYGVPAAQFWEPQPSGRRNVTNLDSKRKDQAS